MMPCRSKPLKDMTTPRRFIYEALQMGGVIPRGGHEEDSCLMHPGELHNMETCLAVEDLLQQMIDRGWLEVGDEGSEEQHICMQSADEGSFGRPKPLVIYFTRDAAPQTPRYPSVVKPIPFPYQNSHAVPWRYAPPSERKKEATDISSLSAKVTNITGLSGVTHSGRVFAPPDLPTQPANVKGKAKIAEEQNDKTIPTPNDNIPVKGLSEKKDGCGKKEVSLEEAGEFLRIIQQSEFKVIEQLNKTPARPGMGLGKNNGGRTSLVSTRGNRGKFGLGYKLTQADIRKSVAGRKSRSQGSQLGRQVEGGLPCHISRSFISAGLGHEGQVVTICEDDSLSGSDLVRPCPPGFRLGNWRVEELPNIYVTSIMMLLQKVVASGGSNLARLGELGGKLLPYFPINRGRSEGERGSALLIFNRSSSFVVRSSVFNRSKRSLAQHLEATEQSMLAIIGQHKEELNQSLTHEQKLVEDFAQAYAEKEARGRMDNEEGVQEQMKADLSALKDQMASITEAMLKIQKTIEDNATVAASNTTREAEPVLQPAINLGRDRNATGFNRRYNPQAYPYGLPPDFTPRTAPDDLSQAPTFEGQLPPHSDYPLHEDDEGDAHLGPLLPFKELAPHELPQPNIVCHVPSPSAPIKELVQQDTHAVTTAPTWMKMPQNAQNSYQHNHPNFSIRAESSLPTQVEGPPTTEKTPAQHAAPAIPRPANNTIPGASYNNARHPPRDEFSPVPMAYSELWPSLLENHLVVAIPGKVFQPPYPKWYNLNATCTYHSGAPGHNIDSCLPFKYKVQHLINAGWLSFQEEGPNVKTNPLASHGGDSVNAIEKDRPSGSKRLEDVATSRRFIYQSLHGYEPEMGLGKDNHENAYVVDIRGNSYKYGLGYEPGKPGRRNAPSRLRADRAWLGHVSQCFTSSGIMFEEEVAAIGEESPQNPPSFVRPCHPNSQVGNWRVMIQSEVYTADSICEGRFFEDPNNEGLIIDFDREVSQTINEEEEEDVLSLELQRDSCPQ
ncbi:hypothetical protein HKD37_03G007230 [Glycine soja]